MDENDIFDFVEAMFGLVKWTYRIVKTIISIITKDRPQVTSLERLIQPFSS